MTNQALTLHEQEFQARRGTDPLVDSMYVYLGKAINYYFPIEDYPVVIDLGCGEATFQKYLPDRTWIGMDLCLDHLYKAKKNNPSHEFVLADLFHLPFKRNTSFLMLSVFMLHHMFPNWEEALRSIHTISDKVILFEPNGDCFLTLVYFAVEKMENNISWNEWPISLKKLRYIFQINQYFTMNIPIPLIGIPMVDRIRSMGYDHPLLKTFSREDADNVYFLLCTTQDQKVVHKWIQKRDELNVRKSN